MWILFSRVTQYSFVNDCVICVFSGTSAIKTSVVKDGHVFCVHVLDPKVPGQEEEEEDEDEEEKETVDTKTEDEGQEKAEMEKQEKDGEWHRNSVSKQLQ